MVQILDDHGRLKKLRGLRQQIDLEIQAIEQRAARITRVLHPPKAPDPPPAARLPEKNQTRLAELGVTALQVKQWAYDQGLIPEIARGRVPASLVEQYAAHHNQEAGTA